MPPKRRTTTPRSAGPQRTNSQQQTLSFHGKNTKANKVTKSQSPRTAKGSKKDPALLEDFVAPEAQDVKVEDPEPKLEEPTTAERAIEQQVEEEIDTLDTVASKTEDVLGGRAEQSELGATGGASNSGWLADEETRARKIPQTQINRYWRAKEQERKAPRVHQEDLSTHEKILREWDMQSHYGPCIGIARLKRWKRANMLGLEPPLEVLAVMLKEMDDGATNSQRAHVDELMSSRFIET
ncbi:Putative DNA polymerase delta, subunit 4 [Septoria linicola]|uniref:DNA polymerase delta, subunit 4 n=1 Tax=Septoria linicola TaxID=215465 RepID=A0A9Q9B0T7_9PEZI|nr:Putative DNA polymerase delta, subunit 4 [Septoria linicola]